MQEHHHNLIEPRTPCAISPQNRPSLPYIHSNLCIHIHLLLQLCSHPRLCLCLHDHIWSCTNATNVVTFPPRNIQCCNIKRLNQETDIAWDQLPVLICPFKELLHCQVCVQPTDQTHL